jgi:hypothetical protein
MIPPTSLRLAAFAVLSEFGAWLALNGGASVFAWGLLGSFGGVLLVWAVVSWITTKRSERYDLNLLREVHDSGGGVDDELPEVEEDAGVVCPHCGTLYGAWMLVCPQCKR